jgi:hypothetical protein
MSQNLISGTLSLVESTEVQQSLIQVKSRLSFLSTLQAADVNSIFKVGNAYLPLIDKVYQIVLNHPEILPPVFDKDEFLRDYELFHNLRPIYNLVNELAESIQKTYTAAGSDTLIAALEVYAAVKQNKDKVPGLSVASDELSAFFKKAKTKAVEK